MLVSSAYVVFSARMSLSPTHLVRAGHLICPSRLPSSYVPVTCSSRDPDFEGDPDLAGVLDLEVDLGIGGNVGRERDPYAGNYT